MESATTISDFVKRHGLTMTSEPATSNPHMTAERWSEGASHWSCIITKGNHTIPVTFSQGAAHRVFRKTWDGHYKDLILGTMKASTWGAIAGKPTPVGMKTFALDKAIHEASEPTPPTIDTVLDCLATDSQSFDDAKDFDAWANEFGFDTDSRKAEKMYRICGDQAKRLRHLLGSDAYAELLYKVERL